MLLFNRKKDIFIKLLWIATSTIFMVGCGNNAGTKETKADSTTAEKEADTVEVTNTIYPERVYWGDQHLHTSWSADAAAAGTVIGPEEGLRFAMGEEIKNNLGNPVKLKRPLDWLCVSDHSDGMGVAAAIKEGDPLLLADPLLKKWNEGMNSTDPKVQKEVQNDMVRSQSTGKLPKVITDGTFSKTIWEKNCDIVDKYNQPGKFTAFVAYEWTSNYQGGNNLHRNIIYRGNGTEAKAVIPENTFVSSDPESLWKWMDAYEKKTGGRILAIPHNGNLSNGWMFSLTTLSGKPLSKEYAETRNKYERLIEVTQVKGTSEAHPSLSPTDEFANFEIWDKGNLAYQKAKTPAMLKTEYIREALKDGIKLEQHLGINPFKYGMAGGSDSHTGLSAMDEDNYGGKFKITEPSPERWDETSSKTQYGTVKGYDYGASGWTGVWATANTREALWDAMQRRETYATTGPRITVRFFGGFDFSNDDVNAADMVKRGYNKGVPMGGDLYTPAAGKKISFVISAVKDPIGANLDRVQVIKGWIDANGNKQEKIYNVVWSDADKRKADANGKIPPVGNTVNLATCEVANTIGATELKTVWSDTDFDPSLSAVYYVRVLEIPTPRWTAWDAMRYKIKMDPKVPMLIQERAYTSPIWYTPKR
jgi:hypothetical protein